jgi:hypothetical protein
MAVLGACGEIASFRLIRFEMERVLTVKVKGHTDHSSSSSIFVRELRLPSIWWNPKKRWEASGAIWIGEPSVAGYPRYPGEEKSFNFVGTGLIREDPKIGNLEGVCHRFGSCILPKLLKILRLVVG